jgi:hypothetical protein
VGAPHSETNRPSAISQNNSICTRLIRRPRPDPISKHRAARAPKGAELSRRAWAVPTQRVFQKKLIAAAAELSIVEKNIERVRSEFEGAPKSER